MSMREVLESLGFEPFHPALTALAAFRAGQISAQIRPDSERYKNAAILLGRVAAIAAPMSAAEVKKWFMPIVASVKTGNMGPDEIVARAEGVAFAFEGMPRFLFSRALLRDVVLKCEWLPTAAEIWPLVEPTLKEFERLRADLNGMLGLPVVASLPSPEEVLHLAGKSAKSLIPIQALN